MGIWTDLMNRIVAGEQEPLPCVESLGLPIPSGWEPGRVWATWEVDPSRYQFLNVVFGGYLTALADHVLGFAAMSVMKDTDVFSTSDLRMSFLRPVVHGTVSIEATVLHQGRNVIVVEANFRDDKERLVAKASATQVLTPMPSIPSAD